MINTFCLALFPWVAPKWSKNSGLLFFFNPRKNIDINTGESSTEPRPLLRHIWPLRFLRFPLLNGFPRQSKKVEWHLPYGGLRGEKWTQRDILGGGFKYFLCSPYLGKWSNLTNIFQMGWNHQPVYIFPVWGWCPGKEGYIQMGIFL